MTMIVGVPKETKRDEYRVGLLPVGVEELVDATVAYFLAIADTWFPGWSATPSRSERCSGPVCAWRCSA